MDLERVVEAQTKVHKASWVRKSRGSIGSNLEAMEIDSESPTDPIMKFPLQNQRWWPSPNTFDH